MKTKNQKPPVKRCENCTHFKLAYHECRRYPPTVFNSPIRGVTFFQPTVDPMGWCGEHKAAK